MQIIAATVINGTITIPDFAIPDGNCYVITAQDGGQDDAMSAEELAALEEAIEEADRGEGIPAAEYFAAHRNATK